jgi:hypothetical protein
MLIPLMNIKNDEGRTTAVLLILYDYSDADVIDRIFNLISAGKISDKCYTILPWAVNLNRALWITKWIEHCGSSSSSSRPQDDILTYINFSSPEKLETVKLLLPLTNEAKFFDGFKLNGLFENSDIFIMILENREIYPFAFEAIQPHVIDWMIIHNYMNAEILNVVGEDKNLGQTSVITAIKYNSIDWVKNVQPVFYPHGFPDSIYLKIGHTTAGDIIQYLCSNCIEGHLNIMVLEHAFTIRLPDLICCLINNKIIELPENIYFLIKRDTPNAAIECTCAAAVDSKYVNHVEGGISALSHAFTIGGGLLISKLILNENTNLLTYRDSKGKNVLHKIAQIKGHDVITLSDQTRLQTVEAILRRAPKLAELTDNDGKGPGNPAYVGDKGEIRNLIWGVKHPALVRMGFSKKGGLRRRRKLTAKRGQRQRQQQQ